MSEEEQGSTSDVELSSQEEEGLDEDLQAILAEQKQQQEEQLRQRKKAHANDVEALRQKLISIKLKVKGYEDDAIPWHETLVLGGDAAKTDENDDLNREKKLYPHLFPLLCISLMPGLLAVLSIDHLDHPVRSG